MKQFSFDGSFRDLSQFGIHCLTGEACAIGTRLLCDLTKTGVQTIEAAFGLPRARQTQHDGTQAATSFAENWNGGSESDPHLASIMLGRGMVKDIAIIGMFEAHKCDSVLVFDGGRLIGIKPEGEEPFSLIQEFVGRYAGQYLWDDAKGDVICTVQPVDGFQRAITPTNHPRRGLQCTHAMTGRSL